MNGQGAFTPSEAPIGPTRSSTRRRQGREPRHDHLALEASRKARLGPFSEGDPPPSSPDANHDPGHRKVSGVAGFFFARPFRGQVGAARAARADGYGTGRLKYVSGWPGGRTAPPVGRAEPVGVSAM